LAIAGKNSLIKATGTSIDFVGETTTTTDDKIYQIDNTVKRVWDRTADIDVYEFDSTELAEAGTDTTTIIITGHGLSTGDLIVNTTQSNATRIVTVSDPDTLTMDAVTGQTTGDSIDLYPQTVEEFTTNRLTGKITFENVDAGRGDVRVSGEYLPVTTVAEAFEFEFSIAANNGDTTEFLDQYMNRIQLLKDVTGTISRYKSSSTLFFDNLHNGVVFVLEIFTDNTVAADFLAWVLLAEVETTGAVSAVVMENISFEGTKDVDGTVVTQP
jgi:hypothetical protein